MTKTEKWLATPSPDRARAGYDRTAVGEDAAIELLHNALTLVEKRNADLARAGQREWTGVKVRIVIDEAPKLFQTPDVKRTVRHLLRYGRKAGVEVSTSKATS